MTLARPSNLTYFLSHNTSWNVPQQAVTNTLIKRLANRKADIRDRMIPSMNSFLVILPSPSVSCRWKKSTIRDLLLFSHWRYCILQTSKSKLRSRSICITHTHTRTHIHTSCCCWCWHLTDRERQHIAIGISSTWLLLPRQNKFRDDFSRHIFGNKIYNTKFTWICTFNCNSLQVGTIVTLITGGKIQIFPVNTNPTTFHPLFFPGFFAFSPIFAWPSLNSPNLSRFPQFLT